MTAPSVPSESARRHLRHRFGKLRAKTEAYLGNADHVHNFIERIEYNLAIHSTDTSPLVIQDPYAVFLFARVVFRVARVLGTLNGRVPYVTLREAPCILAPARGGGCGTCLRLYNQPRRRGAGWSVYQPVIGYQRCVRSGCAE